MAGLGIFLAGVRLVTDHVNKLTGRKLRKIVGKVTESPFLTAFWGGSFGAVALSTSAITFTTISFLSTGLLTLRRAIPLVAWANPGSCLLFVVAFLNIKLFILFLIGFAGISFSMEKPRRYLPLITALFGLGLIFYGVDLMSQGASPLKEMEWFQSVIMGARDSYLFLFAVSAILAAALQSTDGFLIVILTMVKVGLLDINQTIVILYAITMGDSILNWVISYGLKGVAKQLAMFQVLFNVIGVLIFLPLFFLEINTQIPLVKSWFTSNPLRVEQQMAYLLLFYNVVVALLLSLFSAPIQKLLERHWPQTKEEDDSSLRFLDENTMKDPAVAVIMVDKEQGRLVQRLPAFIEFLRGRWEGRGDSGELDIQYQSYINLSKKIEFATSELMDKGLDKENNQKLVHAINRQNLLLSLGENLYQLIGSLNRSQWSADMDTLIHNIVEASDTILLSAGDAFGSGSDEDLQMLLVITSDKGDVMDNMRLKYLSIQEKINADEKHVLLFITEQFERMVWLIRKLALLLENKADNSTV